MGMGAEIELETEEMEIDVDEQASSASSASSTGVELTTLDGGKSAAAFITVTSDQGGSSDGDIGEPTIGEASQSTFSTTSSSSGTSSSKPKKVVRIDTGANETAPPPVISSHDVNVEVVIAPNTPASPSASALPSDPNLMRSTMNFKPVVEGKEGEEEDHFHYAHEPGFTTIESQDLLDKYGPNQLPETVVPKWLIFLQQLWQPMPVMIWIAIIIEGAIENFLDMGILLFIQFANASIGYVLLVVCLCSNTRFPVSRYF